MKSYKQATKVSVRKMPLSIQNGLLMEQQVLASTHGTFLEQM